MPPHNHNHDHNHNHSHEPDPFARAFPSLPIISVDQPRLSNVEKYGALFYLGVGGLIVVVALVGWFAWSAWSLRGLWANVYVLNDPSRTEAERVAASFALAHDPGVSQQMLWDTALSRKLPDLARYIAAEALTAEAAQGDPRAYGASISKSEGWPVWLRLLLTRPLAYSAALGLNVPRDFLISLTKRDDPATSLWATYALAEGSNGDAGSTAALRLAASSDGSDRELAAALVLALDSPRADDRLKALDRATLWVRTHHPAAVSVWNGWRVADGRLVPAR